MYDYIIIGAGIAGLYTGYKLKKKNPNYKILILEKEKIIGGRAGSDKFYGSEVLSGAGVGRKSKDKRLLTLLKELQIPVHFYTSKIVSSGFKRIDIMKAINQLKIEYEKNPVHITFKKFAIEKLGIKKYNKFVLSTGYSDYENEDVENTLYHYGMEDNAGNWTAFSVDWKKLSESLANQIGVENIKTKQNVIKISRKGKCFFVKSNNRKSIKIFKSKKIVIASTVNTVRKLLNNRIYDYIESQPFVRIYGKFNRKSSEIINKKIDTFTVVKGPLQKIIPMNKKNGIYMIAYNDNKNSLAIQSKLKNNLRNRNYFCKLLKKALGIQSPLFMTGMKIYNWKEGTHYYKPLFPKYKSFKQFIKLAQHPRENILVVGEMISTYQGWVEGALESVDKVL
jgi:monoamine oxidase